jgi:Holliday junction resolvase-like predicted endonuclease
MPNPYNKSQSDFGEAYEALFLTEILCKSVIDFIATDTWNEIDFVGNTDKTLIMIELKTRKHSYNTFPTTIVPCGKVKYYNSVKTPKKKRLFFVFCFIDGDGNHSFYYIKYTTALFKTLDRKAVLNGGDHYFIPVNYLNPCNQNFIALLNNY